MKDLTLSEVQQVSGAGPLMELATTFSGGALGCAAAVALFPAVTVSWLGLIPLSLPLAGGIIGASIGNIIYNVEQIAAHMAANSHASI